MKYPVIKRRKIADQGYEVLVDGKRVGEVHKTGTHLDHYPWDWMLDGEPHVTTRGYRYKTTGADDTLKAGVQSVAAAAGAYAYREEPAPRYRVGVIVNGDTDATFNALTFATRAEAETYAAEIAARWTAVLSTVIEEVQS